jgi:hypothetical protein
MWLAGSRGIQVTAGGNFTGITEINLVTHGFYAHRLASHILTGRNQLKYFLCIRFPPHTGLGVTEMDHPPDLDQIVYPSFEFPWPGGLHPEAAIVEERMIEWGSACGLIPNKDYHARVIRTRYGFLAARCYPRADMRLLQAIADYFLWFFLADDLFVDRVDTATADTIAT